MLCRQVKEMLQDLSVYTEYLDNNPARDLQTTHDPNVFRLTADKRPYPASMYAQFWCVGSDNPIPNNIRVILNMF